MTISITSAQSGLLLSDMPVDASISGQMNIQLATADGEQIQLSDNQFLDMLNQNLIQVVSDVDGQVVDSKELLSMLGDLGSADDISADSTIPAQWMQFLKSHFNQQSDSDQALELVIKDEEQDEQNVVSLVTDPGFDTDSTTPVGIPLMVSSGNVKGDGLPSERQTITTKAEKVAPLSMLVNAQSEAEEAADASSEDAGIKFKSSLSDDAQSEAAAKNRAELMHVRQQVQASDVVVNKLVDSAISPMQNASQSSGLQNTSLTQALPPHLQSISVSASANNQQWGDAIGERVSFLINQKLNSAEIRIDPPHLGKLDIQIHLKDDAAQVVIHTQHAQTRDLVENSSFRLREFLQDAGYSSVDVNVSHRDPSSQQNASAEGQSSAEEGQSVSSGASSQVDNAMQPVSISVIDGRIDYFA